MLKQTRTYAVLTVSKECYDEIMHLLQDAGYDHAFHTEHPGKVLIDMHGIALSKNPDIT
jgi:hypothetical protein